MAVPSVRGARERRGIPLTNPTYHLECHELCSLREGTAWGDKATAMLVDGRSLRAVIAAAKEENVVLHTATLARHKKHIIRHDMAPAADERVNNIEILDQIIQRGFANRKNWKPTISDTMKALDMHFRLTSGNPFDELLNTLASAGIGEENPASIGAPTGVEAPEDDDDDARG